MIIVNLKGGLGNQMFQYALGKRLALQNSNELKLHIEGLARANEIGNIYRPFSLEKFNIEKNICTDEETRRLKYPYGIFSKGWRYFSTKLLRRANVLFDPNILTWRGDIFLDGYWQSPKYFADIRDTLCQEFTLKEESETVQQYRQRIRETDSVAIHVRRGDYVSSPTVLRRFGVCSLPYYQNAIQYVLTNVSTSVSTPHFFIFSDDIDWVKANLNISDTAVFISSPELSDADELYLMSQAKHNIIANSSFSWWAAWLNQNPAKIVVAPTPWFDRAKYDASLIPSTWITLQK